MFLYGFIGISCSPTNQPEVFCKVTRPLLLLLLITITINGKKKKNESRNHKIKKNKFPNIEDEVKIGTSNCSSIEDTALHSVST